MTISDLRAAVSRPAAYLSATLLHDRNSSCRAISSASWGLRGLVKGITDCILGTGPDRKLPGFWLPSRERALHPVSAAPDVPLAGSMSAQPEPEPQRIWRLRASGLGGAGGGRGHHLGFVARFLRRRLYWLRHPRQPAGGMACPYFQQLRAARIRVPFAVSSVACASVSLLAVRKSAT